MLTMSRTATFGADAPAVAPNTALNDARLILFNAVDTAKADPSGFVVWSPDYLSKVYTAAKYVAEKIGMPVDGPDFPNPSVGDVDTFINKGTDLLAALDTWASKQGKQTGYRWIWILGGAIGLVTTGLVVWRIRRKRGRR